MKLDPSTVVGRSSVNALNLLRGSASLVDSSTGSSTQPPTHKFITHLLMIATAQLAAQASFTAGRRSTLGALSEIASKYIESIGIASATAATLAGRSEVNLHDMLYGLQEMGIDFAEMRQWKELAQQHEEIPFAHAIPTFPQVQEVVLIEPVVLPSTSTSSSTTHGATATFPRPPHIPSVLPAFPPRRTYAFTPEVKSHELSQSETTQSRKRKIEENRKLESALVTLHQAATKAALEMAIEAEKELRMPDRHQLNVQIQPPSSSTNPTSHTGVPSKHTLQSKASIIPGASLHIDSTPLGAASPALFSPAPSPQPNPSPTQSSLPTPTPATASSSSTYPSLPASTAIDASLAPVGSPTPVSSVAMELDHPSTTIKLEPIQSSNATIATMPATHVPIAANTSSNELTNIPHSSSTMAPSLPPISSADANLQP